MRILTKKREEWVNNIANLTLLKRKKNAQALNGDFDEKRKIYGGKDTSKVISCYDITKDLYNYRKWNEKSLQERYDSLYGIITPILHIEGQEEEYEDEFDLE